MCHFCLLNFFFKYSDRNVAGATQSTESEHCKAYYVDCPGINLFQA